MRENRETLEPLAETLREHGWGVLPPEQHLSDMDESFLEAWKTSEKQTLISPERGWAFAQAIRYVCRGKIPGDLVECGVFQGGACLLASLILHEQGDVQRKIWLYDTFSGMVSPGEEDKIAFGGESVSRRNPKGWWSAGVEEVKNVLSKSPLALNRFNFVEGSVEKTLLERTPNQIAVLRLDTDWYESTKQELEILYPKLSPGGVLLIDDYGHFTGARKAVDEYFDGAEHPVLFHRNDYTGRAMVKNL